MALTDDAHKLIKDHLDTHSEELSVAIDATCGKGSDTLFLLELGFKKVLAFDIQAKAVEITRQRLKSSQLAKADIFQASHEYLEKFLSENSEQEKAQCIMFNLGYLPTVDKVVTTKAVTTITALSAALRILSSNGILSIMSYPGHSAGATEKNAVVKWLKGLGPAWLADVYEGVAPKPTAPVLYLLRRSII